VLRRRPPARSFKLGFGDYALAFGGKQGFRRTRTGVPSRDFLEDFIAGFGEKSLPLRDPEGVSGPSDLPLGWFEDRNNTVRDPEGVSGPSDLPLGWFGGKTPRRGRPGFRPEIVRSMPVPPPETNGEASTEAQTETGQAAEVPVDLSTMLNGGLDDMKFHPDLIAKMSEAPQGVKGSKVAGVKRARQFMRGTR